jgi:hypothetical protein
MRAVREAQAMSTHMIERVRELAEKDKDRAQTSGSTSREPQREHQKTGPVRSESRHGAGAKRSDPSPEGASSRQMDRDDGPSR